MVNGRVMCVIIVMLLTLAMCFTGCVGKAPEVTTSVDTTTGNTAESTTESKPTDVGHEHSYTSEAVSPTCVEKGYTKHTCTCGDSYKRDEVAALGHDYKETVVAATTSAGGYTLHKCSRCGDSYKDSYTDKLPSGNADSSGNVSSEHKHSYTRKVVAPTCTEKGYTTYTCACGDSYTDGEKAATGHSYKAASTVAPTCKTKGFTVYQCSCGDSYNGDEVNATGHSWGDWITTKEATVSAEGQKSRTCGVCEASQTERIDRLPSEVIDTAALEAYGRQYAYETYGYDGNPNCNPSTGCGYFPGATKYIYTMEEGYALAREGIDAQYADDMGGGRIIFAEIDGTLRRRQINIYFEETSIPNMYIIWVYYGGTAEPYCK